MAGTTTTTTTKPTAKDVVLGTDNRDYVRNDFLQDLVRLQRVLAALAEPSKDEDDKEDAKLTTVSDSQVDSMVNQIYTLLTQGKDYQLAGVRHVPTPCLSGAGGKVFASADSTKALAEKAAKKALAALVREEWTKPLSEAGINLEESPYPECKALLERYPVVEEDTKEAAAAASTTDPALQPTAKDAILIHATEGRNVADRVQEHELGNKVLFNMAAQLVTTYCTTPNQRVRATMALLHSLEDATVVVQNPLTPQAAEAPVPPPGSKARFLLRTVNEDERSSYTLLDATAAAFFALAFVFEIYLEKGLHLPPDVSAAVNPATLAASTTPTTDHAPTDFDVLFGRGGLTNAHPGNRRFRDVISLHRPDYIRAIKMDKPAVARRIVRSIRMSAAQPGRFLKKHDDGQWYDVGDRTAAEKTSQGLRERSNAEKRQRHALREALRIRKQDMPEDGDGSAKAAAPANLLPILNYVGTNLAVPLSLGMKDSATVKTTVKRRKTEGGGLEELQTEGLPPNAVDEEGNILVTDHDILYVCETLNVTTGGTAFGLLLGSGTSCYDYRNTSCLPTWLCQYPSYVPYVHSLSHTHVVDYSLFLRFPGADAVA
jgi:hypothetical protein